MGISSSVAMLSTRDKRNARRELRGWLYLHLHGSPTASRAAACAARCTEATERRDITSVFCMQWKAYSRIPDHSSWEKYLAVTRVKQREMLKCVSRARARSPSRALTLSSAVSWYLCRALALEISYRLLPHNELLLSLALSISIILHESEDIVKIQMVNSRACTTTWCQEDSQTRARITIVNVCSLVNRGGHPHFDFPLVTCPHAPLLGHVLTVRRPADRVIGLRADLVTDAPVVRRLVVVKVDRSFIRRLAEAVAATVLPDALERPVDHIVHALPAVDRNEDALHRRRRGGRRRGGRLLGVLDDARGLGVLLRGRGVARRRLLLRDVREPGLRDRLARNAVRGLRHRPAISVDLRRRSVGVLGARLLVRHSMLGRHAHGHPRVATEAAQASTQDVCKQVRHPAALLRPHRARHARESRKLRRRVHRDRRG